MSRIACVLALATAAWPASARAYHDGSVFDAPPGAGGAGGLFYTGSVRDRGWDCTSCHIDPRGALAVTVTSQPPELIAEGVFRPGTPYAITVAFASPGAQLGLAATRSNFNGIAITALDPAGAPAGTFSGFDAGRFYARGTAVLASQSPVVDETSWTFTWTAPAGGAVALDLGVVDGNGAGQTSQSTLTDPLGDDVAMFHFVVAPASAAQTRAKWASALALGMLQGCRSPSSAPASSG